MKYTKLLKQIKEFDEAKKDNFLKPINPFKTIPPSFLSKLTKDLQEIELKFTKSNLVSTSETLKTIKDPELIAAVQLAGYGSRAKLLGMGQTSTSNAEYAALTPLLMLAMKRKHGIMYNDWDREDSNLRWATGKSLATALVPVSIPSSIVTLDNIAEIRANYLKDKSPCGWGSSTYNYEFNDRVYTFYSSRVNAKILTQTWIACADIRVPHAMILDVEDWDKVPEPYDIVAEPVVAAKKEEPKNWWDE